MAARQIVILGGGFAGVYTAMSLEKVLRPEEADIHLVSKENYIVFSPMLPEVLSGSIGIMDAITPIRRLCHRTRLHCREVEKIDLERRVVVTSPGIRAVPHELPFDHLVLALGNVLHFGAMPGVEQHALPFKTLGDAVKIRDRLIQALEEAEIESDPEVKQELLTFVVAGGGFAGAEGVAEINDFVREAAHSYQSFKPADLRVVLLQSGDRILKEVNEKLGLYAQKLLTRRGVELVLYSRLAAASASEVIVKIEKTKGGPAEEMRIPCRTLISTVPSAPHPLVAKLPGAAENRGKLPVDCFLRATSMENVWGLGDCCQVPAPDHTGEHPSYSPPTAQHAIREGKTAARNLAKVMRGQALDEKSDRFGFSGLGQMGCLGRFNAVAQMAPMFGGFLVSGVVAWLMWRVVYLGKLPGWDRKLRVFWDWVMDLTMPRDLVRLKFDTTKAMNREHFEPGQFVFKQGDEGDRVYMIAEGDVDVVISRDGSDQVVNTLKKGDVFGEMALVSHHPRNASMRARTRLDVVTLGRHDFEALLAHMPWVKEGIDEIITKRRASTPRAPEESTSAAAAN